MNAPTSLELKQELIDKSKLPQVPTRELKKYVGVADRVLRLLCSGCSQEQAAQALGISPSYVSQLCQEEDFQIHIAERIKKDFETAVQIDNNYLEIERILSDKLKGIIPYMHSPDQILRVIKFVNESKKKTAAAQPNNGFHNGSNGANGNIPGIGVNLQVALVLPNAIAQKYVVNPNNEVLQVGETELVTLNSESMNSLISAQRAKKAITENQERQKRITLTNEDLTNL